MRAELEHIVRELSALCGGAKVFVLPFPYKSGHFRMFMQSDPEIGEDYAVCRCGENLFAAISDEKLLSTLRKMDEALPEVSIEPQAGVFQTLLYQMLQKNWTAQYMDEPLLVRMALELDQDAERCRRTLMQMQPLMHRAYARALREGREKSVLTAVARQAVYHMNLHNLQTRNGEIS